MLTASSIQLPRLVRLGALLVLGLSGVACSADPAAQPATMDATPDLTPTRDLGPELDAPQDMKLDQDAGPDLSGPPVVSCQDDATIASCVGERCELTRCRGDELCQEAACIPWEGADLNADFTLSLDPQDARRVIVEVAKGGFPRSQVDALRFDFGDGVAGWAELVNHRYDKPGVYPVTLEVRLSGHRVLTRRKLAVIEPGPTHNPLHLTINQLPDYLSGIEGISFTDGSPIHYVTHHVPRDNFDIDVTLLEDPNDPIDLETLALHVWDDPMNKIDLRPRLSRLGREDFHETIQIRADAPLPAGVFVLTLYASTKSGLGFERRFKIQTIDLPSDQDPLSRPMIWLLRDDVDLFTTTRTTLGGNRYSLSSTPTPNGQPDLIEELRLVGAQGDDEALNKLYLGWIRAEVNKEIYRIFGIGPDGTPHDDIALKLIWSDEPGAPAPASFDKHGEFSMMRFGGVFDGALGYSSYSAHNQERADNSIVTRGVASAGILSAFTSLGTISEALAPLHLENGTPVGAHPHDAKVLERSFDPYAEHPDEVISRYKALKGVAQDIALALGAVTAHEMGHAMGLMPNGLPPEGFFGQVDNCAFVGPRTNSHHADLPGLNLMQAGGNQAALIAELQKLVDRPPRDLLELVRLLARETKLSPLSRAYLQRRLTYTNKD